MNRATPVQESGQIEPLNPLISSKDEINELASELADGYVDYFTIDISEQQGRTAEAIEECLTHLEEVCSLLDNYRQKSHETKEFVQELATTNESLEGLYEQVDALQQYLFETNRVIDQLETTMKEIEAHKKTSGKMRQIMEYLPKISLSNVPGVSLLSNFGGLIDEPAPSFVDDLGSHTPDSESVSVNEILTRVSKLEETLAVATSSLETRLRGKPAGEPEVQHVPRSSSIYDGDAPNQVDGSWQELL